MLYLVLGLIALWLAPLLVRVTGRAARAGRIALAFLPAVMGVLIIFDVMPYAHSVLGPAAILIAAWGLLTPLAFERFVGRSSGHGDGCAHHDHHHEEPHGHRVGHDDAAGRARQDEGAAISLKQVRRSDWWPLILVIVGLGFHAAVDGSSFATAARGPAGLLPLLAVAHRLFEGLFLWSTVSGRLGSKWAVAALALNTAFATTGYFLGEALLLSIQGQEVAAALQALVAGSLLHLIFHRHLPEGDGSK